MGLSELLLNRQETGLGLCSLEGEDNVRCESEGPLHVEVWMFFGVIKGPYTPGANSLGE